MSHSASVLHAAQPADVGDVFHLPPSPLNGDTSLENLSYEESKTVAVFTG